MGTQGWKIEKSFFKWGSNFFEENFSTENIKDQISLLQRENTFINPLNANSTNWLNTFKQFVDELFEYVWPFCRAGTESVKTELNKQYKLRNYCVWK